MVVGTVVNSLVGVIVGDGVVGTVDSSFGKPTVISLVVELEEAVVEVESDAVDNVVGTVVIDSVGDSVELDGDVAGGGGVAVVVVVGTVDSSFDNTPVTTLIVELKEEVVVIEVETVV